MNTAKQQTNLMFNKIFRRMIFYKKPLMRFCALPASFKLLLCWDHKEHDEPQKTLCNNSLLNSIVLFVPSFVSMCLSGRQIMRFG